MNDAQKRRFNELADQMIEFINEVGNPHSTIIIDCTSAELLGGESCYHTEAHLKD
jgi:hypothetical protein